jgi:hypothetical protein
MTITPNQDFKDRANSYEKGQEYDVSEEDVEYFESCGWIGEQAAGEPASLDIQDIELGHSSEVN